MTDNFPGGPVKGPFDPSSSANLADASRTARAEDPTEVPPDSAAVPLVKPTMAVMAEVVPDVQDVAEARSLWMDAWITMRRRPLFWISVALIAVFVLMAAFPQLFSPLDAYNIKDACDLNRARLGPDADAIFGYDLQGCDVYARTIYGARSSILVGIFTTLLATAIGVLLGTMGGFIGRWIDTLMSRTADIFFAIPLLLGGIIILYSFPSSPDTPYLLQVFKVVFAMAVLGWPNIFRIMRSSVMQVKPAEYVMAARALGGNAPHVIMGHIIPNAIAPVIVVATIDLGAYIATEATLSFLGIGLQNPIISWGIDISAASALGYVRQAPHMLIFPSIFLSLTVLAFIMLGEVVRDALDPKLK